MLRNQRYVLDEMGLSEGGRVDDPDDPGGRTNHGVTQRTFSAWLRSLGAKDRDVWTITKEEAETIFIEQYLRPVNFDELPPGIDYMAADYSVNSGPAQGVKDLQRSAGMAAKDVDGIMGIRTMAAVWDAFEHNPENLISTYAARRLAFMKGLKHWWKYKNGWTARVEKVERIALELSEKHSFDAAPKVDKSAGAAGPQRADPADKRDLAILDEAVKDPVSLIPVFGTILAPIMSGNGPVQFALAAVIVMGAAWVLLRYVRRKGL